MANVGYLGIIWSFWVLLLSFFLGEIRTMLNLGLIMSYGEGKSFYVLNPQSHESWDFAVWLERQARSQSWVGTVSSDPSRWTLVSGSLCAHVQCSVLSWLHGGEETASLQSSLSTKLFLLWCSVLWAVASLVYLDSQLCLLGTGSLLCLVSPSCAMAPRWQTGAAAGFILFASHLSEVTVFAWSPYHWLMSCVLKTIISSILSIFWLVWVGE